MSERGCVITGWGSALPPTVVANADLESILDTSDEWIVERSGVRTRRAATGPFVSIDPPGHPRGRGHDGGPRHRGGSARARLLGTRPDEIGFLLLCTTTPDQVMPATSSAVAGVLGIDGGAVDLNAACAGFTYGLITVAGIVATGARKVLLIGAETMTARWTGRTAPTPSSSETAREHWCSKRSTAPAPSSVGTPAWTGHWSTCSTSITDRGMIMKGPEVFRRAVRATVGSANAAVKVAGVGAEEIALFIPHQANQRIMEAIADRVGIAAERIVSVIDRTGNTSSASIPLALVDAVEQGRLTPGDVVLFAGFGAGMTWSSVVWRWNPDAADVPEL